MKISKFFACLQCLVFCVFWVILIASAGLPSFGQEHPFALHGKVVLGDGPHDKWITLHRGSIAGISDNRPTDAVDHYEFDGFIYPGFIDTHNHVHWNTIPRWNAGRLFNDRYEWQTEPEYMTEVEAPYRYKIKPSSTVSKDSVLYGKIRAIAGGATMIQSSFQDPQPDILIRNLDEAHKAYNWVASINDLAGPELDRFRKALNDEQSRVFFHLCEGRNDPQVRQEFKSLALQGFLHKNVVVIHGVALQSEDFKKMHDLGMFLVWSPRSNFRLYGQTTDILAARAAGVTVSLAPDWAATGSSNLLDEMRFAYAYSLKRLGGALQPEDLYKMITSDAALVAGQPKMGEIKVGNVADLVLIPKLDVSSAATAYSNLLHAYPSDIHAVFVAGEPVYGDISFMKKFRQSFDTLTVGTGKKGIFINDVDGTPIHVSDLQARLMTHLPQLAPVFEP